ncbi:MAG: hypothetical protein RKP73_09630 [Candidatus Contendobacter sp.]|nr:hypothetical protein [Candidatus Contendobacter sp.]
MSYFDFGFLRRALIGTIMTSTKINQIISDPYVFGLIIYSFELVALTIILALYCLKNPVFEHSIGYAVIFFSPAMILHSGYNTGTQDLWLLIIASLLILFVRPLTIFTLLCCVGILVHELFIFMLPAILLIQYYKLNHSWSLNKNIIFRILIASIPIFFS